MEYTLDILLSQINDVAKRPSIESLRVTCSILVRSTLLEIGREFTGHEHAEEIEVRDHRYIIPSRTLKVDDVGFYQNEWRGILLTRNQRTYQTLAFADKKDHLWFPNFPKGRIWIKTWELPVDETGSPVIPEEAFNACYAACLSRIVSTTPASPHWQDRIAYRQDVAVQIRIARGLLNETTEARYSSDRNPNINNGYI